MSKQIEKLTHHFFKNLQPEEMLNFSTAVVVMKVQKRWRARTRAIRLRRRRAWRMARREEVPSFGELAGSDNDLQYSYAGMVGEKYEEYKRAVRDQAAAGAAASSLGSASLSSAGAAVDPLEHRWKFNPELHPMAEK